MHAIYLYENVNHAIWVLMLHQSNIRTVTAFTQLEINSSVHKQHLQS